MMIFVYLLLITAILSSYRLFVGPTIQDRLVSLSCVSVILIIILVILSIHYNQTFYLDIAIAFLLLDFVGVIAFVKYLGREEIK
ncbi:MAG: monovalent cation/H+ antiporter complex subunit F [Thermoplasmatota archaeon]|jgi:multisubunit Na+/H+ antiporter MnhF subunit